MAQIVLNGGESKTHLTIIPDTPRRIVIAYRQIERIRGELEHFKRVFATTSAHSEEFKDRLNEDKDIRGRYVGVLKACSAALKTEIDSMPEDQRRYYRPVLIFLSRAADAHTILPFVDYLHTYVVSINDTPEELRRVMPYIPSLTQLRGFIEERIAESIIRCDAYCALISGSLGSYITSFPLNSMLSKIATIQREVSIHRRGETLKRLNPELCTTIRKLHNNGLHFDLEPTGDVFSIPALVYFLMEQIMSNAFKASFGGYIAQKTGLQLPPEYAGLPELSEPQVDVCVSRLDIERVKVVITDNGIGIPPGLLERLIGVEDRERIQVFKSIQESNGSSTSLFPFIADLLGAELLLKSEGIGKGFTAEIILPMDISMRTAKFAESK